MELNPVPPLVSLAEGSDHQEDSTANLLNSTNLMKIQTIFGFTSQIYNWNKTGITFKLNAPIVNVMNHPLLMFKVTPTWLPTNYISNAYSFKYPVTMWELFRPWYIPIPLSMAQYTDLLPIGDAIDIFEEDDPCLLSVLSFSSLGWTGGLEFQFRIVSNSTSQGKIQFSRVYNVNRPHIYGSPHHLRTPLDIPIQTQSMRLANSAVLADVANMNDTIISCPYSEPYSWVSNRIPMDIANGEFPPATCEPGRSYICLDIVESLLPSAGASTVSIQVWIRAKEDFQFIGLVPLPNKIYDKKTKALYDPKRGPMRTFGKNGNIAPEKDKSRTTWVPFPFTPPPRNA